MKCKEGCTGSLRAIRLVSGTFLELVELAPAKPKGTKKKGGGDGEKIHYVKDNLAGKYQNVSSTPDSVRGGKLSGGFCQRLKQAWIRAARDGGCGLHFALNLFFIRMGKKI